MTDDEERSVRTYDAPHEAELAAAHLRSIGIDARVHNDLLAGMNPLWGYALGGIQVVVPARKLKRARRALEKLEMPKKEADPDDDLRSPSDEDDATAARAFRAAILGIFFCPVGAHVYSLWLIAQTGKKASARGRRNRNAALGVNIGVLLVALFTVFASDCLR
jgi:hypothetical protein